jgi:hypothetical protein
VLELPALVSHEDFALHLTLSLRKVPHRYHRQNSYKNNEQPNRSPCAVRILHVFS